MKRESFWVRFSIVNLCTVAFIGVILRTKIIFPLPFIDYNRLLDAHGHFAFGAWVTLTLMFLMAYEILPEKLRKKSVYRWMLSGIGLSAWMMMLSFAFTGNGKLSNYISTLFILFSYAFAWVFIRDIRRIRVDSTVKLLAISSVVCLILSSLGTFALAYLFAVKSLNVVLYKDALYTYLHFQYNGFFTLSVFALLFHELESRISLQAKRNITLFSLLLISSIIPSQFLTYLWQGPNKLFLFIAVVGSLLLLLSLAWFIRSAISISRLYKARTPTVRFLVILSMIAFMLKTFLQSFTIFTTVGNAVFGDRPMIIGFLHLVFLGFVSIFILAYYSHREYLNINDRFTRNAIGVFTLAVIFNEVILMSQGLGAMLVKGSQLFQWLLWIASIWLFTGALMLAISILKYPPQPNKKQKAVQI